MTGRRAGLKTPGAAARFFPYAGNSARTRACGAGVYQEEARSGYGVRGVTGARENVNLEAPGSTPAEYPRSISDRDVLLGEQRASKTRGQGSNPCVPAAGVVPRLLPLECAGFARDPPKVADQVRFLARASARLARRGRACIEPPRECVGRMAVFEAAGPGPIPGRGIVRTTDIASSECAGSAHDLAKVGDQVRFLARTSRATTVPRDRPTEDAGARRPGDRLQPGSSGFDSHRRLSSYPASHRSRSRLVDDFSPSVDRSRRRSPC